MALVVVVLYIVNQWLQAIIFVLRTVHQQLGFLYSTAKIQIQMVVLP